MKDGTAAGQRLIEELSFDTDALSSQERAFAGVPRNR
jgi:hypothetical protein